MVEGTEKLRSWVHGHGLFLPRLYPMAASGKGFGSRANSNMRCYGTTSLFLPHSQHISRIYALERSDRLLTGAEQKELLSGPSAAIDSILKLNASDGEVVLPSPSGRPSCSGQFCYRALAVTHTIHYPRFHPSNGSRRLSSPLLTEKRS